MSHTWALDHELRSAGTAGARRGESRSLPAMLQSMAHGRWYGRVGSRSVWRMGARTLHDDRLPHSHIQSEPCLVSPLSRDARARSNWAKAGADSGEGATRPTHKEVLKAARYTVYPVIEKGVRRSRIGASEEGRLPSVLRLRSVPGQYPTHLRHINLRYSVTPDIEPDTRTGHGTAQAHTP